jgi:hypothetical protein
MIHRPQCGRFVATDRVVQGALWPGTTLRGERDHKGNPQHGSEVTYLEKLTFSMRRELSGFSSRKSPSEDGRYWIDGEI